MSTEKTLLAESIAEFLKFGRFLLRLLMDVPESMHIFHVFANTTFCR